MPTFQRVSPPVGVPYGHEKKEVIAMPAMQAVAISIFISLSLNQTLFNRLYLIGIFTGDLPPIFVPPLKLEFRFKQTVGA